MAGNYNLFHITKEMRGQPPVPVTTIEQTCSENLPEGAIALGGLQAAEEVRARNARLLRTKSGAYSVLLKESDLTPKTELTDLARELPSGTVVYEPLQGAANDTKRGTA